MRTVRLRHPALLAVLFLLCGGRPQSDDLDAFIEAQMARRQIVGLSLAIIDDGKIVTARGYGTTARDGGARVTPATLFQAGSISKPVAALGALQLVESGKLSLDEDVNAKLKSWKVPDNQFTQSEHVTVRRLLTHSAGLTVHGFPGYAVTERLPSVPEVLDGKGNTAAVRVDIVPGSTMRYSGGGYTVLQQLMIDVTGQSFPDYMRDHVLLPLGMTSSTYQQPLPPALAAKAASGYYADRSAVAGKWHVYPEMAAAGLWTTPSDLARYALGVMQAYAGKSKLLSAQMTRQMLTEQKPGQGLGPAVGGTGATFRFTHGGRDEGFDAFFVAYPQSGDGVAIMINANDNSRTTRRIVNFIAKKYNWADQPPPTEAVTPVSVSADVLAAVAGRYEFSNNNMITLLPGEGRLYVDVDGLPDEEFVAAAQDRFVSTERGVSFRPLKNASGEIDALELLQGIARRIPRIGPLFPASTATDPDPAFTRNVMSVLQAFAGGGQAVVESKFLTDGARKDFSGANPQMRGVQELAYVLTQDVTGRGIERHGHAVARVVHYRMNGQRGPALLLIHVDPGGLVTDYDIVNH